MDDCEQSKAGSSRRRMWSKAEDEKFVECLLELSTTGTWKADNGTLKPGFLVQVEKWMAEKIPKCDLKAQPHIRSRIKLLKKQYNAISEMLGPDCSGFRWNDRDKCIEAEKHTFDEWIKSHPTTKGLRNKPFSFLEQLAIVFGKDRANGLGAKDSIDMFEAVEREICNNEFWGEDSFHPFDPPVGGEKVDGSTSMSETSINTQSTGRTSNRSGKKRARSVDLLVAVVNGLENVMSSHISNANENIQEIALFYRQVAEREYIREKRRNSLVSEIRKVGGLSVRQRVRAGMIIIKDQFYIDYFFTLLADEMYEFLMKVLQENADN